MKAVWIILIIIAVLIIAFLLYGKYWSKKLEMANEDLNRYAACVISSDAFGGIVPGRVACKKLADDIKKNYGLDDSQIEEFLLKSKIK